MPSMASRETRSENAGSASPCLSSLWALEAERDIRAPHKHLESSEVHSSQEHRPDRIAR